MISVTENIRAIAAPANNAGTPRATAHARGSEVNHTTAHCTATMNAAVPSARRRLPPNAGDFLAVAG